MIYITLIKTKHLTLHGWIWFIIYLQLNQKRILCVNKILVN